VRDRVRDQAFWRVAFLVGPVPGSDQHASPADIASERDIEPAISDRERPRRIHAQLADRPVDKTSSWLATVAGHGKLGHASVAMVRTIVIRVDVPAAGL